MLRMKRSANFVVSLFKQLFQPKAYKTKSRIRVIGNRFSSFKRLFMYSRI